MSALRTAALLTAFAQAVACGFAGVGSGADPNGAALPDPSSDSAVPTSDASVGDGTTIGPDGEIVFLDGASAGPELVLDVKPPPAQVELEAEGTLAWIHWGTNDGDKNSKTEKKTAVGAIPTFTLSGSGDLRTFGDNLSTFRWTNGAPLETQNATRNGVYSKKDNAGTPAMPKFTLSRKAGVDPRRFVVYAGVFQGKGHFTVRLGTGPTMKMQSVDLDSKGMPSDKSYGRFVVDYRTPEATSDLVVTWELATAYDPNNSNVTLPAATLAPRP